MKRLSAAVIACILCISMCFTGPGYEELSGYAHSYGSTAEKFAGTAPAYGASYEKLEETTEAYVNPLYEDVITEADLVEAKAENGDQPSMLAYSQSDYVATISEAAGRMRQGMKNRETTIEVPIKTTSGMTGIAKTIFAEVLDHNGVPDEGDYIRFQYGGWKSSASGYTSGGMGYYTVTYTVTYYTTAAQEAAVTSAVAKALNEMKIEATDGAPKKIKKIYDYVTARVTYDNANLNNSSYLLKYTAYAALINGTAVCQGYANLMYRFCLEAGIDCRIISGTGNSGPHGWNIVQVGDKYYNIDATWDAGKSSYSYFLKSDADFPKHTRGGDDGDSSTLEIDYTSANFYAQYPMYSASYSGDFTEHTHVYNSGVVTKAATCTSSGSRTFTCIGSGCGDTKTETIAATGHKWDSEKITTAATCTTAGVKTYTCSNCMETKTETIAATGHTVVTDAAKAATCTESGLTEGSHCSVCKAVIKVQTSIAATGHSWDSGKITTAATCTTAGVKTYTCSSCKATKTETISATGHTVVTDAAKAATCTESGLTEGSHCSVCKAVIKAQTTIAAKGHTVVTDAAKAATCTESGLTEGSHCSVCNTVIKAQTTIAAKGHTWDSGKITIAATCTTAGVKTYTCSTCKMTKTEAVAATGHTVITDAARAATCTESGLTEGSHCSVCNTVIKAQTTIAATGHKWDSGKVSTAATCTTAGVKTYTCSSCKETKTEAIVATGHTVVTDATKAATCTESGLTEGSHCSVCNAVIKAQTSIAATGHKMDAGKVITSATCTTEGVKLYTCSICNKTITEDIPATGHVNVVDTAKAATCTDSGLTEGYHCIVCNTVFADQNVIPATGHSWDAGKTTTLATCTGAEIVTYTCTVCSESRTEASSSAGHTLVTDPAVEATCTSTGLTKGSHCSVCNATIEEQEVVPLKAHTEVIDKAVEATCTSTGLTEGSHCSVCNATITAQEVTGMKSHTKVKVVTKATLTKDGSISYKCSECGIVLASVAGASSTIIARPKTFTLSKITYTYDGKVKTPTLTIKDSKGNVISSGNYSVAKDTGRKLVGTYSYKITFKGNYSGTKTVSFKINPKGTSIVSLTRLSKGFTVKWKKQSTQTTGYQVRYSISSKMTNAKTVTISKNTTVSKTVSKLTAKKKYYVQIRTYKTVKTKKYYSGWSATRYVVTK